MYGAEQAAAACYFRGEDEAAGSFLLYVTELDEFLEGAVDSVFGAVAEEFSEFGEGGVSLFDGMEGAELFYFFGYVNGAGHGISLVGLLALYLNVRSV